MDSVYNRIRPMIEEYCDLMMYFRNLKNKKVISLTQYRVLAKKMRCVQFRKKLEIDLKPLEVDSEENETLSEKC